MPGSLISVMTRMGEGVEVDGIRWLETVVSKVPGPSKPRGGCLWFPGQGVALHAAQ